MPVILDAQNGVLALPSDIPFRYWRNLSYPTQYLFRKSLSARLSVSKINAILSINAVSVPGLICTHSALLIISASISIGLMLINSIPFWTHFFMYSLVVCFPTPPEVTWAFLRGNPPNITINSELSFMLFQSVWVSRNCRYDIPITWGIIVSLAA